MRVPLDNVLCFLDFGDADDCLDRLRSEVEMRHKEAIWLSLPNFYRAVKQFVEEQCGIALFDTDEAIYSMQVLHLTQY